jgi:hypothetical protein
MKKIIVIATAVIAAGYVGYVLGTKHALKTTIPMRDMYSYSHVCKVMEDSYVAYCEEDPTIAVWALERMIEHLEAQKNDSFHDYGTPREAIDTDIMLSYGRLAKVTQSSDPTYSEACLARAVEIGKRRYTNEALTEMKILEIVDRLDAKRKANRSELTVDPLRDSTDAHTRRSHAQASR